MTRKDSEKDAERPHYYSQFWLDIAAGRRVIGGPKPEEAETSEPEAPEPVLIRKSGRNTPGASDTYRAASASPAAELAAIEVENEPEEDTVDEADLPNIVVEEDTEYLDEAESDAAEEDFSEDEEEFFDEEEEEEEEDEEGTDWSRRGRKKAKPVRPVKPVNKPKRSPRRGF